MEDSPVRRPGHHLIQDKITTYRMIVPAVKAKLALRLRYIQYRLRA